MFKTKIDITYDIVLYQLELGTSFDYISADGFYGNGSNLVTKIDWLGLVNILDIQIITLKWML